MLLAVYIYILFITLSFLVLSFKMELCIQITWAIWSKDGISTFDRHGGIACNRHSCTEMLFATALFCHFFCDIPSNTYIYPFQGIHYFCLSADLSHHMLILPHCIHICYHQQLDVPWLRNGLAIDVYVQLQVSVPP